MFDLFALNAVTTLSASLWEDHLLSKVLCILMVIRWHYLYVRELMFYGIG